MALQRKTLRVLHGSLQAPPLGRAAQLEIGILLRRVQRGLSVSLPHSRPMPAIGARVHELRVNDRDVTWRVIYRIDEDEVVVAEVFAKKTEAIPPTTISVCKSRYRAFDHAREGGSR